MRRAGAGKTVVVFSEKKMLFGFPASRFPVFTETHRQPLSSAHISAYQSTVSTLKLISS